MEEGEGIIKIGKTLAGKRYGRFYYNKKYYLLSFEYHPLDQYYFLATYDTYLKEPLSLNINWSIEENFDIQLWKKFTEQVEKLQFSKSFTCLLAWYCNRLDFPDQGKECPEISSGYYKTIGIREYQEDFLVLSKLTQNFSRLNKNNKILAIQQMVSTIQRKYGQHKKTGAAYAIPIIEVKNSQATIYTPHGGDCIGLLVTIHPLRKKSTIKRLNHELHNPVPGSKEWKRLVKLGITPIKDPNEKDTWRLSKDCPLAMSRALGDTDAYAYGLKADPDISIEHITLTSNIRQFVVLGSDGLMEQLREEDILNTFCEMEMFNKNNNISCKTMAQLLTEIAILEGSTDNVSVIVYEIKSNPHHEQHILLGVFDGHGGTAVSQKSSENVVSILEQESKTLLLQQMPSLTGRKHSTFYKEPRGSLEALNLQVDPRRIAELLKSFSNIPARLQ